MAEASAAHVATQGAVTNGEAWLVHEFDELPRSGDTVYGFAVGIYPTDQPILPPEDGEDRDRH